MGYAGHALDMIKRLKEGREPLKRRREARRKGQSTYIGKSGMPQNMTAEKFEEINQASKKHELEQKRYLSRMTFILTVGIIGITMLVCIGIKLLFF